VQPVLTVSEMRAVDELAQRSVPIETLIGRAGVAVATQAIAMLGGAYGRRVAVVAGRGNNGNDGRVAGAVLEHRGARVAFLDPSEGESGWIGAADLVIDAAYGTGFRGTYAAPRVPATTPVLAVDVPSGLDADLGAASPSAVRATRTVTFGALKPGLLLGSGPDLAGGIELRLIGLPVAGATPAIALVEDADVGTLPPRRRDSHKWTTALMVVAGSPGMYGAATFVSRGAARSGAGMVRLGIPGPEGALLPAGESVARALPFENFDGEVLLELARFKALVIGPGLGTGRATAEAIRRTISRAGDVPTLIDADGLTALGDLERAKSVIKARRGQAPVVLTPHEGEFARLAGAPPGDDRIRAVRELASGLGATVLLKGPTTIVASPNGDVLLASAGSPALATAGSGDVLSGVVGALLARGVDALEAAGIGAHVHGLAARLGRSEGLVAGDLPELVADAFSRLAPGSAGGRG